MKGARIEYSEYEEVWVKVRCHLPRRELHRQFCETFGRDDVSQANLTALCKRQGWLTGRTGRFEKGHESHNKGKKGYRAPGSEKGWFRMGERRGVATKLYKPIGTERISKDGYVERKVHDGLPLQSRWRAVHMIRWEAAHGPLPEGHALKCLDGDKTNCAPSNWEAVPRALLPRLNGRFGRGFDRAPEELKPTIMAVAKLEHAAREARQKRTKTRKESAA